MATPTSTITREALALGHVLVIGGCGFPGSHIVRMLLTDPSCTSISVFSRNPTTNTYPSVTYHAGNISDLARVKALFTELQPRVIIHTSSPRITSKLALLHTANIVGTTNLLKCAVGTPSVKAFVYTSSESALHPSNKMVNEETCVLYTAGDTKAIAYQRTKATADTMGNPYMILPLLEQLRKGENKVQVGRNTTLRDSLYVGSAASAHTLAAKALLSGIGNSKAPKVDGEAFLLSDGEVLPFYVFMRKCWRGAGGTSDVKDEKIIPMWVAMLITGATEWLYWTFTRGTKEPAMKREVLTYLERGAWYDTTKSKERLGWNPLVTVDEGI